MHLVFVEVIKISLVIFFSQLHRIFMHITFDKYLILIGQKDDSFSITVAQLQIIDEILRNSFIGTYRKNAPHKWNLKTCFIVDMFTAGNLLYRHIQRVETYYHAEVKQEFTCFLNVYQLL